MNCPNCGEKIQAEDQFCTNCGFDLLNQSKKVNKNSSKLLALVAFIGVVVFILLFNRGEDEVEKVVWEESEVEEAEQAEVVEQEEVEKDTTEKRTELLLQADEAIETESYDAAVTYLEEVLAIEPDETTETLKEMAETMDRVSYLYIEDELSEAYDELRALLAVKKEREEYTALYQQAEDLKDEIKTSHQLKWDRIIARGGEWDSEEQTSLLDLEYGLENPDNLRDGNYERAEIAFLTYLDNDFVKAHLFDEDSMLDGIYLFYQREDDTSEEIAYLAEQVDALGIPVWFYAAQRDQTIALLANYLVDLDISQSFLEEDPYYVIVKGGQETDSDSLYLTKKGPDAAIAYLKQVIADGQY